MHEKKERKRNSLDRFRPRNGSPWEYDEYTAFHRKDPMIFSFFSLEKRMEKFARRIGEIEVGRKSGDGFVHGSTRRRFGLVKA